MELNQLLKKSLLLIGAIKNHPDTTRDQLRDLDFVENDLYLMLQETEQDRSNVIEFRRRA